MATRKPLIVNPDASQIQELPNGDSLDGITNLTATGTVQAEQLTSTDDATVTGEITVSGQPACLLTVPKPFTATGNSNHQGGTNEKPISFTNTITNVNCTTSLSSNATVNSGISSITVPSTGTYLVTASISGKNNSPSGGGNDDENKDQVRLCLAKTGISTFLSAEAYPASVFGNEAGEEFNINFTLPLQLAANDALSVHFSHVGESTAAIEEGYFSVTKLH